ncbi:glycosyl-4,4'-diaponeurosporenoate acyltransferase CrtO family protein [Undibacterium flavidum]|uniref:Glycosyl-4,4'-diaponeurosporenoate acyltransferase n=1 Tax=Undibacterium flavidum TaxID=2762297 RepID=A0ABR6Y7S2_9BURK|nr:hypothetical protein [Undibacterium flavidum]MBC3872666.1 hypothetical protein [Undibacterium flavidum]
MKKIFLPLLIVIATIASTMFLVSSMRMHSLAFAWALNFLLMFWVSIFTETQTKVLTLHYYRSQPWEKQGKFYEHFGINLFRKLLVVIGWEKLNKKANPIEKSAKALAHNLLRTKKSEFAHLIIFLIVVGMSVMVAINSRPRDALWLIIFNIIFNLYPVLLQRYNRPRIERALQLIQRNEQRIQNRSTVE